MSELLRAQAIVKNYRKGPETIEVLKGLDLEAHASETIAVVGASGVGKSTLLHLLGALDRPSGGSIFFRGEDLSKKNNWYLARFRNGSVGFIFQFHYLLPEFTAEENVAMPLRIRGETAPEALLKARGLLEAVGLSHRVNHKPAELSGGEQQRVAIARALIGDPSLILADEPTGDLDLETGRMVTDLMFAVIRSQTRALIMATHNPELAARADRVLRLREGRLHEEVRP
ncbi:MAG: ABC transporter ATP-binding protein [Pseudomonadota bacterium]